MKNPRDVVIVDGTRTPFAKSGSKLRDVHAAELGTVALKELIQMTAMPIQDVDEVIIGNTGTPSDTANISRVVALRAGLPLKVPAYTVHRNCASALESISQGFEKIKGGLADMVIAGGTESMSQMPLLWNKEHLKRLEKLSRAKTPVAKIKALASFHSAQMKQIWELVSTSPMKQTKFKPRIALMEGLTDPFKGINMGHTAEILAKEFGLSREEQDQFALESHQKAVAAMQAGRLSEEITPLYIPPKYKVGISADIGPRETQSLEALKKLKPIFDRKFGTVTAGNACPITDGAAMVLMMSREKAESLGYKPLVKVRSYGFAGLEPERMGLGPVYASPVALKRAGLELKDMGLIELNEAFAAQVMGCMKASDSAEFGQKKLGLPGALGEIDPAKLNVNGGAIAIGHPVGATGTRLVLTLAKEMKRRSVQFGLATLCIGGGLGGAMVLENEEN